MGVLQIISLSIGIPLSLFNLLILICRPVRNWLFNKREEEKREQKREEEQRETDKCLLRDRITDIYYEYKHTGEIKQFKFENVAHLYERYKALGGNSFVDKLWREIKGWIIVE